MEWSDISYRAGRPVALTWAVPLKTRSPIPVAAATHLFMTGPLNAVRTYRDAPIMWPDDRVHQGTRSGRTTSERQITPGAHCNEGWKGIFMQWYFRWRHL